jgi:hypothetical protein
MADLDANEDEPHTPASTVLVIGYVYAASSYLVITMRYTIFSA